VRSAEDHSSWAKHEIQRVNRRMGEGGRGSNLGGCTPGGGEGWRQVSAGGGWDSACGGDTLPACVTVAGGGGEGKGGKLADEGGGEFGDPVDVSTG
jgi:hypothetical protein